MSKYELTFDSDASFAISFGREFLWNTHGGWIISSLLLGGVAIVGLVTGSYVGFWSFCLGMASLYWIWLLTYRRRLRSLASTMKPRSVNVVFDENGCAFNSSLSSVWVAWSNIGGLRRLKCATVLEGRDGHYSVPVPSHLLTADVFAFLEQCVKRAGGKIR